MTKLYYIIIITLYYIIIAML